MRSLFLRRGYVKSRVCEFGEKNSVVVRLYATDVNLITVSEVLGHGRQMGVTEYYRGVKETENLLRKIRLEIAVNENFVEPTIG